MARRTGREALRGAEAETLDLIYQVLTSEQWAKLLKGPLERAAGQGNRRLAQKLLEAGAQIGNALHEAVHNGHGEVVHDLLGHGASINAQGAHHGRTPLHVAAQQGETEVAQLLMLKGADKDSFDAHKDTPLLLATKSGRVETALAILAAGADVNVRTDQSRESVLHISADKGYVGILRAAVERGADVDGTDTASNTALHKAASRDKAEVIDVLVEAGANIEARDSLGITPLVHAAVSGSLYALTALLKRGADVNAQGNFMHSTPLHYAAANADGMQGAHEVVDTLLRSGADETIIDDDGETAADSLAEYVEEGEDNAARIERVRMLLRNAPADRAWRRRGYLALCRAYPARMHQAQASSSAHAGLARQNHHAAKLRRPGVSPCHTSSGGSIAHEKVHSDWVVVVGKVLGLQEEGIFRTIVGYL